jgi:hypothetical protein
VVRRWTLHIGQEVPHPVVYKLRSRTTLLPGVPGVPPAAQTARGHSGALRRGGRDVQRPDSGYLISYIGMSEISAILI